MESMEWKKDYEEFEKVTRQFYAGEVPVPKYKGFSAVSEATHSAEESPAC